MRSALYRGTLMHARREPVQNVFKYGVAYFLLDLDELERLNRFWPVRLGLIRFRDSDHFDGSPVKDAALALADDPQVERVLCLTQLRVFGYVFNPVSFYWCYRGDGTLSCLIAELNNTFGERLPEVLRGPALEYEQAKRLHVSPFFGLDQDYEWRFTHPEDEVSVRIHVREEGRRPLTAVLHGRRTELSNGTLLRFLLRYPLMPLRVTALIHWQALRLFVKRVPFHHKPDFVPGEGSSRT